MKRVLVVAAAALAAVVLYTTTAPAGQQAVTPGQFAALQKKVTKLRKDVDTLGTVLVNCVMHQAYPVKEYGGLNDEGYQYHFPDGHVGFETALDLAPATETNVAWFLAVEPTCAAVINSGGRTLASILRSTPAQARPADALRRSSH
jgi:hypothetical protein